MAITPLPDVPLRSDAPATFVTKADAFLGALNLFATEVDAVGVALTLGATNSTSVTSLLIGVGSKSLTVQTGKSYVAGMTLKIASTASPSNWMLGDITSYVTGTGALVINITSILGSGTVAAWTISQSAPGAFTPRGVFRKESQTAVAFTATAAFAVSTATILYAEVGGAMLTFASGLVVSMPTAIVGTDYAIWAETAGTLTCTNNHTTPPTANARKIGGFHYAPGGNATAQAGGNTTPYINAYSFWDLKFKPACQDPRGMTLVAGNFWADIYLLNTDPDVNGTSKYNVTIADGASPPKVPTKFGGNGTTTYTTLTWWEANEVLAANGKRSASYQEYAALAFGTTEASAIGTDQVSTILNAVYTSKWGVMQTTGVMDVWGKDFGGGAGAWTANTTGRGSTYQPCNPVAFGGNWSNGVYAGSRFSYWVYSPASSGISIGSRGVTDHLLLD